MHPREFEQWLLDPHRPAKLMGVLNLTPDSFSDGGRFLDPKAAVAHAERMLHDGAAVLDIGGESTRPGSAPVSTDEQIARVVPVLKALRSLDATISIDTTDARVAAAALDAGATIINDVSAGRADARMLSLAAERGCPMVLMHMLGTPRSMQAAPEYAEVLTEVHKFLRDRRDSARRAGLALHRILLDVGIGFGKTLAHNLNLLHHHASFATLGQPLVLGTSRKAFIGTLTGVEAPADRVMGTAGSVAWGATHGAALLRVHDVLAMRHVLDVVLAIDAARSKPS